MDLKDRVTIVTGAGSGIGRAVARKYADEGARRVVVADLDEEKAVAAAEGIGDVARGVGLDVADESAVKAMVDEVEAADGPVDVFFSNAGYGRGGGIELSNEAWQRMMDVHFMAHLYAARAVIPSMVAKGEGYILSTASAAGLLTQMDSAPYAVTKHAAVAFAEWLAIEYHDKGIRVSCLCPQAVRTNIIGDDLGAWDRRGGGQASQDGVLEPEEVAQAVVDVMAAETFLVLPHPEVTAYFQRKAGDYDRWLAGMRKFKARLGQER